MYNKLRDIDEINLIIAYNTAFFVLLALVVVLFFYFSRKKIIQKKDENRNLEIQHERELVEAILTTQEEERKRIAQDLHDDISSKLNVVSLNSHLLLSKNLTESERVEISNNIINITQNTIESSRRIAHDLYPPVLQNFGLMAGIDEICTDFRKTKSVQILYKNSINFESFDLNKQLHLFRIVQELLNNSIRHGKAQNIAIVFSENNNFKHFKYIDDGIGFDLLDLQKNKGLGMKNIESRVNSLKGSLLIKSSLKNGFQVAFNF
jgi:signal transduction histidine kinase